MAQSDPGVQSVVLLVDSPGGHVGGLFALLDELEAFSKPKRVVAASAQSAAFAIASLGGRIEATGRGAQFGSVGVAATMSVDDHVVNIASTAAPKKRPDVRTEQGRADVREYLDQIHALFVETIARGRRTNAARVNASFGRGATLLADAALSAGMIDSIAQVTAGARQTGAHARAETTQRDMGERVVELMRARREGREPAAWAREATTKQPQPCASIGAPTRPSTHYSETFTLR
jgi:ClpP class serine protease